MEGQVIGQYRVTGVLGEGGMGIVYAAQHTLLDRPAAIKVLLPKLSGEQEIVHRFFNEARAATAIRNPGIVEVYDFGWTKDGAAFIVMEYLEGESLRARCKRGPIRWSTSLALARQVAGALAAAHAKGIVHRDLKPDNIFLVPDSEVPGGERIKLLDFGIAKLAGPASGQHKTRTGMVIGTPTYMAPEQCRGIAVDGRADLYALGCILFELCTGEPPFFGEGEGDVLVAHIHTPPPKMETLASGIPKEVESLVQRLLAKAPADRFQTADELIHFIDMARTAVSQSGMSDKFPVVIFPGSVDDPEDERDIPASSERGIPESAARTKLPDAGSAPTLAERSLGRSPRSARVPVEEEATAPSKVAAQPAATPPVVTATAATPSSPRMRTTLSSATGTISLDDPPVTSRWWKIGVGGIAGVLAALGTLTLALGSAISGIEDQVMPLIDLGPLNASPPTAPATNATSAIAAGSASPGATPKVLRAVTSHPSASPTAASRWQATEVSIHIESSPTGASIYRGDVLLGPTPQDLKLARGDYDLELDFRLPGYHDQMLVFRPLTPMRRTVKLKPATASPQPSSPEPPSTSATVTSPAPAPSAPSAPAPSATTTSPTPSAPAPPPSAPPPSKPAPSATATSPAPAPAPAKPAPFKPAPSKP